MEKKIKKIVDNFLFAKKFGDGFFGATFVFFATLFFPLKRIFHGKQTTPFTLHLVFHGNHFPFFVRDSSDIAVLKEVFLFGEYALVDGMKDPDIIIDLGSNIGASVVYFSILYPNARIIAMEADPVTVEYLKMNVNPFPNVLVQNYAISDENGLVPFYIHPESRMSSSLVPRMPGQQAIQVSAITLEQLFDRENIKKADLLKFDIEGAEFKVFFGSSVLARVKHIVGEIHLDLIGVTEAEMLQCFEDFSCTKSVVSKKRFIIRGSRKRQ